MQTQYITVNVDGKIVELKIDVSVSSIKDNVNNTNENTNNIIEDANGKYHKINTRLKELLNHHYENFDSSSKDYALFFVDDVTKFRNEMILNGNFAELESNVYVYVFDRIDKFKKSPFLSYLGAFNCY